MDRLAVFRIDAERMEAAVVEVVPEKRTPET